MNDYEIVKRPDYEYPQEQSRTFGIKKRLKSLFSHHDTVWERMLSLYSLPEVNNYRVDAELNSYLRNPGYIYRIQERAAPYMHLILDEIEAKGLPGELALLPVVESAFIPEAYSRSAASGLWQFIPSTGRLFGLEQNSWYDGRRDIYASTVAATSYLKELSAEFGGDYFLALASYNWGKGNVAKAIARNDYQGLPTDYWSLDMPRETEDYVPRLLAVAKLFANAEKYGIRLQNIPNKPYCEVVNVGSQLDLDKAAELAQTPLSLFLKLNPCYKKGSTAPYGPHRLLIPKHRAKAFKENLARLPYDERVANRWRQENNDSDYNSGIDAKVRQNEALAQRLRDDDDKISRRKHEVIASAKPSYFRSASTSRNYAAQPTNMYKVQPGQTLSSIAKNHGTSVDNLKQINHLAKSQVNWGSYLKVPTTKTSPATKEIAKNLEDGKGKRWPCLCGEKRRNFL